MPRACRRYHGLLVVFRAARIEGVTDRPGLLIGNYCECTWGVQKCNENSEFDVLCSKIFFACGALMKALRARAAFRPAQNGAKPYFFPEGTQKCLHLFEFQHYYVRMPKAGPPASFRQSVSKVTSTTSASCARSEPDTHHLSDCSARASSRLAQPFRCDTAVLDASRHTARSSARLLGRSRCPSEGHPPGNTTCAKAQPACRRCSTAFAPAASPHFNPHAPQEWQRGNKWRS